MNVITKAVVDKWAATDELNDLLSSEYVVNGLYTNSEEKYPFATLTLPGGFFIDRTNCDIEELYEETVRIALYSNNETGDYAKISEVAHYILKTYRKWSADLDSDRGKIIDCHVNRPQEIQDENDGFWTLVIDLNLMVSYKF